MVGVSPSIAFSTRSQSLLDRDNVVPDPGLKLLLIMKSPKSGCSTVLFINIYTVHINTVNISPCYL